MVTNKTITAAQQGCHKAQLEIINEFKLLIHKLVSGCAKIPRYETEDIVSCLQIEVLKCIQRYDDTLNVPFTAFVSRRLRAHILDLYFGHVSRRIRVNKERRHVQREREYPLPCGIYDDSENEPLVYDESIDHTLTIEMRDKLAFVFRVLTQEELDIIVMKILGYDIKYIGEVLGYNNRTLWTRTKSALQKLYGDEIPEDCLFAKPIQNTNVANRKLHVYLPCRVKGRKHNRLPK